MGSEVDSDRARGFEARLARVEERYARLEERIDGDRAQRKEWREEVLRRLGELNGHYAQIIAEREHLLSKETYEAQHTALERVLEVRSRDLAHENKSIFDTLERKMGQHDQDDNREHEAMNKIVSEHETWINNQKGRQWALGVGVSLLAGIVSMLVQVLYHIFTTGARP